MRDLNLIARFPLGVYLGHRGNGLPDRIPSPARLHSALLNAAGQGTAAVLGKRGLEPSAAAVSALTWLENNPPTGIMEPECRWLDNGPRRFAYRNVSSINVNHRTEERRVSDGVAFGSPIGFRWSDVPDDVADTVLDLAADVSCLGEASSVVVIEVGDVTPTIELDPTGSAFDRNGILLEVPIPGRTSELMALHGSTIPEKKLTVAADKSIKNELPASHLPTANYITDVFYRRNELQNRRWSPWDRVLLLEVEGEIVAPVDQAQFCLAMHRALVSAIGFGASGMITGKYSEGVIPPANRLAIQYLPPAHVRHHGIESGALALLIPSDALNEDLEQLATGLATLTQVWTKKLGRRRVSFTGVGIPAEEFWEAPEDGAVRMWRPQPAVVSEIRPPRRREARVPWSLADSGLLSLGFVWRDRLAAVGKGMALYTGLRDEVAARGAFVVDAHTLGKDANKYVHRTHRDVTAQVWSGVFHLGDLVPDRTILAVGQSRHLGGGLLVPVDVPEEYFEAKREEERVAHGGTEQK